MCAFAFCGVLCSGSGCVAGKRIACRVCSLQLVAKVYAQQHNSHNSPGIVVYCLSLWTKNGAYTWYNFGVSWSLVSLSHIENLNWV